MPTFYTVVTNAGATKIAAALAASSTVDLFSMAVGDGNGNPTTPNVSQTALVRERYRAPISNLVPDTVNPNRFIIDMQVPMSQGGWTIHEVGVFDSAGVMIAVGNVPATYKPLPSEGSARDLTVRVAIEVSNGSVINLTIDPAIVIASQDWVLDNFSLAALIPGGNTGQILAKNSNANGDVEWVDPNVLNVTLDVVKESQTLTAGQTIIDLAVCQTTGIAVYVEGARYEEFTIQSSTRLTLAQSFPTGTKLWFYQNDPLSTAGGTTIGSIPLLEDVGGGVAGLPAVDGRNLKNTPPPGTIVTMARFSAPTGWMECDGAAISRTTYADLFNALTKQTTGDLTSGSAVVPNVASVTRLAVGMTVEGPGIPNGTTVTAIAGSQLTLSQNVGTTALAAALRFFAFGNGNGSNTFNIPGAALQSAAVPFITCIKV